MPGNQKLNITPNGTGSSIPIISSVAGQPGYPAANPPIKGATVPYWAYGRGVPTYSPPVGSMYTNTSAASGQSVLYVYTSSNTWHALI